MAWCYINYGILIFHASQQPVSIHSLLFVLFYTFAHLKRRLNNEKISKKCKNLVSIRLETDMKFKNLLLYKIHLVVFLHLTQNLLYSAYFGRHSYLCYELFRIYA